LIDYLLKHVIIQHK